MTDSAGLGEAVTDSAGLGPLAGVDVVDLSRLVAGNQLSMLLADFGATVVKVERPDGGDSLRNWLTDGEPLHWKVYGRNKKSVTVDLKNPGGVEFVLRLAQRSQVLLESFRPGVLERLGLGPERLLAANPALVIVRISGWGQTGSRAGNPGFGTLIEAMSGLAASNGFADREPALPPGALADMVAGTYGAFAVLGCLRHAEATGRGQVVDLSLFEPLFSVLGPVAAVHARTGRVPRRLGSRSETSAPRNVYRTSDGGYVALSGSTEPMARRLFAAIGRPELGDDPRFRDNASRLAHVEQLDAVLGEYFGAHPLREVLALMDERGVTVGPVMDIGELAGSEFFATRGVLVDGPDPDGEAAVPMPAVVPRLSRTPGGIRDPAPRLGQHTRQIAAAVLGRDEMRRAMDSGAFG